MVANSKCGRPSSSDVVQSCQTTCPGRYVVRAEPWGACSKACGGGVSSRTVTCWDTQNNAQAPLTSCNSADTSTSTVCNVDPCVTSAWRITPLLHCYSVKSLVASPYLTAKAEYGGLTYSQFLNLTASLYCGGT
jgi:hypothetical protein